MKAGIAPDRPYFYKLEDVDTANTSTFNGPVQADMSTISLIAPTGAIAVPARYPARFVWKSVPRSRFRIEFSNAEDFSPAVPSLHLRTSLAPVLGTARQRYARTPTLEQWKSIKRLSGPDRTLYWRVSGKNSSGTFLPTRARILRIR